MEWYINNRELIKNLAINTGTTDSPTYTNICTTSEIGVETELEEKIFMFSVMLYKSNYRC